MSVLGPIIGLLGLAALIAGAVMWLPIKALRPRRSLATKLLIGGAAAFVVGGILTPTPPKPVEPRPTPSVVPTPAAPPVERQQQPRSASPASLPSASPSPAAAEAESEIVLTYIRQAYMQIAFCTGETSMTQRAIDKLPSGAGTSMQAYSAAHNGERDCRKALKELTETERAPFKAKGLNGIFSLTLPACRSVTQNGAAAMAIAKDVIDGNSRLAKVQMYKDARNTISGKIYECKMGLAGLAEAAGVPKTEVDFLDSNLPY